MGGGTKEGWESNGSGQPTTLSQGDGDKKQKRR